jgi:hypothetical protein
MGAAEHFDTNGMPPPHDLDAEAAVLSSLLIDPNGLADVREVLGAEHFYAEAHRQIYRAMLLVRQVGTPIDIVTVGTRLKDSGRIQQVGGMGYLTEILNAAPAIKNVRAYADRVRELWMRRQIILSCHNVTARGYVGEDNATNLLAGLRRVVDDLAQQNQPGGVIPTLSAADLAEPLPDVPYLVPAIGLAPGPVALLAGYGFSGKTLAAQDMALAVATGGRVWGVYAARQGKVLHLDYEQGRHLTQVRYQRLARGRGIDLAAMPPDALRVACLPSVYVDRDDGAAALARMMDGCALVIVDSLRAAAPSADENSSEIRRHLDALSRAADVTGATVVVIHHARKPSKEHADGAKFAIRGSSALFDACASVFIFEGVKGEPTKVHHEKDRIRGDCVPTFGLRTEDITGPGGDPRWGLRVRHLEGEEMAPKQMASQTPVTLLTAEQRSASSLDARVERIRMYLRLQGPFDGSKGALAEHLEMGRTSFFAAYSVLEARGEVLQEGRRGGICVRLNPLTEPTTPNSSEVTP